MSNNLKPVRHSVMVPTDADFAKSVEHYGFAGNPHFFAQAARALMKAYSNGSVIKWPIEFEVHK